MNTFDNLELAPELLKAVQKQGYTEPTPIQAQAIPAVLSGKDVLAAAQTGTGKTAGFTLPLLQLLQQSSKTKGRVKTNNVRALIVTPTRELAAQVHESVITYGKYLPLKSAVVFGGVSINPQMMSLRKGVDVLVATPGRLLDLQQQNAVRFDQLEVLILDEADRMLDMGFIHDIRRIIKLLPPKRQNLMFSATFSADIRKLAATIVRDPIEISVSPANTTVDTVEHWIHPVDKTRKTALLIHLIKTENWFQVLVFSRTKHGANRIVKKLDAAGIKAAAIHGNKSQGARTRALSAFKAATIQALVATDIAARGIDINLLPQVVNFDLPSVPEDYVHRIGRTGRAGMKGQAVSLVSADEFKQLSDIEHLIKQLLPRKDISGFEPKDKIPASSLERRARRTKKAQPNSRSSNSRSNNSKSNQSRTSTTRKPSDSTKRSNRSRRRKNWNNKNS